MMTQASKFSYRCNFLRITARPAGSMPFNRLLPQHGKSMQLSSASSRHQTAMQLYPNDRYRCEAVIRLRHRGRLLRVDSAISVFSGADAQIGRADYVSINSSLTGVAEEQTHESVTTIVSFWPGA